MLLLFGLPRLKNTGQNLKDRGNWHSLQHGNYGILINTWIPIPQQYNEFVELAEKISEEFAEMEEWYHT